MDNQNIPTDAKQWVARIIQEIKKVPEGGEITSYEIFEAIIPGADEGTKFNSLERFICPFVKSLASKGYFNIYEALFSQTTISDIQPKFYAL